MKLRNFFLQVHLWLGLATGLIVAIVCFTGALLAFEEEAQEALHPGRYFVEQAGDPLPLREVVNRVQAEMPDAGIGGVTVHGDPERSLELGVGRGESIFADPYTGEVLEHYRYSETYFFTIFALHRWLLGGDTGKMIVGICTLLFLVILVSGVWVWWPKSKRQLKARTRVTARFGWKRLNYDLHVSLGIFAAVFLFLMGFTGLAWSFEWFNDAIYWAVGSSHERAEAPASTYRAGAAPISLNEAYEAAADTVGASPYYRVSLPRDSASAIAVRALPSNAPHEFASSTVYLDQYTGDVLGIQRFEDRTEGRQARATFYAIHIGSIYGMPTRIIAFVACLLGAFFPITGALVWYNKRWKRWRRQWREWRQGT